MNRRTYDTLVTFLAGVGIALIGFLLGMTAASGTEGPVLTVDGVEYTPSQVSGPVFHYETPDTNPTEAFTDRNVWTGNGSDNLPCEGGIHWIDNNNLLTVSHCLEVLPTTTVPETSTSTQPPDTTTTTLPPSDTSTTVPETTTTQPSPTTTAPPSTTTTVCYEDDPCWDCETMGNQVCGETPEELPFTGVPVGPAGAAALALLASGAYLLRATKKKT